MPVRQRPLVEEAADAVTDAGVQGSSLWCCGGRCLRFRLRCGGLRLDQIRFLADHTDAEALEGIRFAIELSVVIFDNHGELGRGSGGIHTDREVSDDAAFDVAGLVAVMLAAPDEDAEAVELVWFLAFGDGGPE